jgi:predicted CoA-binding protein
MNTLVLGASVKPHRYANKAMLALQQKGHKVVAVGNRAGEAHGISITKEMPTTDVDTLTMYLGATNQKPYYEQILALQPRRIIFNPGAENPELAQLAQAQGVVVEEACTLVLLSLGEY